MINEMQEQLNDALDEIETLRSTVNDLMVKQEQLIEEFRLENSLTRYSDVVSMSIIRKAIQDYYLKTQETVAAGFTIKAKTGFMQLTAASAVTSDTTTAIEDGVDIGQFLFLVGTDDTNTVTIKDAANTAMAGDLTLGANDTLFLFWTGSIWAEISRSNN